MRARRIMCVSADRRRSDFATGQPQMARMSNRTSTSPLYFVLGSVLAGVAACHQETLSTAPPVTGKHDDSVMTEQELKQIWTYLQLDKKYAEYQSQFSFHAGAGAADAEAPEFKKLNDKYGTPGNPATSFGGGTVGVWVYYPLKQTEGLLQLRLTKNLPTQEISFEAFYCVKGFFGLPDLGDPKISMKIPLTELDEIVASGVEPSISDKFYRAVLESQWKSVGLQSFAHSHITLEYD